MTQNPVVATIPPAVTVLILLLLVGAPGTRSADPLRAAADWIRLEARETCNLPECGPRARHSSTVETPVLLRQATPAFRSRCVADAFLPPPRAPTSAAAV